MKHFDWPKPNYFCDFWFTNIFEIFEFSFQFEMGKISEISKIFMRGKPFPAQLYYLINNSPFCKWTQQRLKNEWAWILNCYLDSTGGLTQAEFRNVGRTVWRSLYFCHPCYVLILWIHKLGQRIPLWSSNLYCCITQHADFYLITCGWTKGFILERSPVLI